ncbi:uncharacterized protein LOC122505759 [Leptopilina heterotoma]|uniref:uncharacterized protein LOC122505759 n=1 Tax=Leptopilina heterotoma TaxID=63436 RepID=UPI001CA8361D|nr:uncharacterized protein LOC122505759 [Leptopilina heterotoma]
MKFLSCSRCFSTIETPRSSSHHPEVFNPLIMTKRPKPKIDNPSTKTSFAAVPRFPTLLKVISRPWRRRKKPRPKIRLETRHKTKKRDLIKEKIPNHPKTTNSHYSSYKRKVNQVQENFPKVRDIQHYEKEYTEQFEALKFLIDPPDCFKNPETRQNFENKLNTLDFRRMNTVAIALDNEDSSKKLIDYYFNGKEIVKEIVETEEFSSKLDKFVHNQLKIEETMINLLNREPILKKDRDGSPASRKTVRFLDDEHMDVKQKSVDENTKNLKMEKFSIELETNFSFSECEKEMEVECVNADVIIELKDHVLQEEPMYNESFVNDFNFLLKNMDVNDSNSPTDNNLPDDIDPCEEFGDIPDVNETDGIEFYFLFN